VVEQRGPLTGPVTDAGTRALLAVRGETAAERADCDHVRFEAYGRAAGAHPLAVQRDWGGAEDRATLRAAADARAAAVAADAALPAVAAVPASAPPTR